MIKQVRSSAARSAALGQGFSSRRAFLQGATLWLSSHTLGSSESWAVDAPAQVRFALLTDMHHADKAPAGTRYYRETLSKLTEAATQFAIDKPDFLVELGDMIDAADSVETELNYLRTIFSKFEAICADRHCVLGNHCVDTLTKQEFLQHVGQDKSYYSFDRGGIHFVVLDACFKSDGTAYGRKNFEWTDTHVPSVELDWLEADLANAGPTIVFAHQRLDLETQVAVRNAVEVRQRLEKSGRVLAVFQGHSHENDYRDLAGIHYCTLAAMVEGTGPASNGYSLASVYLDDSIQVQGFRRQQSYRWDTKNV